MMLSACGNTSQPPLTATDVTITRPMPGMQMSAGYFRLTNHSDKDISISQVTSDSFASVEMHETTIEGGISKMRPLENVVIAANSDVLFERGGKHLMLMRPKATLDAVSLKFYGGDELLLSVTTAVNDGDL